MAAKKGFKPVLKDSTNPHFRTKYASLAAILEAVEQPLLENGLILVHLILQVNDTDIILVTRLFHESGQYLESTYPIPHIADLQKMGSAITYAKRYSVSALLSVVGEDDDDAESTKIQNKPVSAAETEKTSKIKAAREAAGLSREQVIQLLKDNFNTESPRSLTHQQLDRLLELIQGVAAKTSPQSPQSLPF